MPYYRLVAWVLLLCTASPAVASLRPIDHAHILVLNSYHAGDSWTDGIMEGIKEVFQSEGNHIDLVVEHMDTRRYAPDVLVSHLQGLYQRKYQFTKFDLVMVSDNEALDFVLTHRAHLFPGTPIVFCGIENVDQVPLGSQPNITGVAEDIDIRGTLELARTLHPNATKVGVIREQSTKGQRQYDRLNAMRTDFEGRLEFEDLSHLPLKELRRHLELADEGTVFALFSYNHDIDGRNFADDEVLSLLVSATTCPIYTFWEHNLNHGALGGVVISGRTQGQAAARIAMRILSGESAASIPLQTQSPNVSMIQADRLKMAGLHIRELPTGTVILNQPPTFYQQHQKLILSIACLFAMISGGAISLYLSVLRRRRAESSLQDSEQRYLSLFETSRDGIVLVDMNDHITDANSAFLAMTGYSRRELNDMAYADFTTDDANAADVTDLRREIVSQGYSPELEQSFHRKDGSHIPVSVKGSILRDAEQRPSGIWWVVRDVSARKKTEEALRSSEEQLRHSQKLEAVGRLAGGVAHDFNNLLTSILGYSMLALESVPHDGELYEDLEHVVAAAERAKALTAQLLTFGQKNVTDIRPLDINAVVLGMDDLLRRSIGEDVELVTVLHEDPGTLRADAGQLEQIVMNLAVNARDAMPNGGCLRIETGPTNLDGTFAQSHPGLIAGQFVMLRVSDTGTGIPPEVREHVFEPFFSTKDKNKGTGLGLATVYGIVRQYGGTIDLESETGKGTSFTCYFPSTEEQTDAVRVILEDEAPLGTETIVLVEDQQAVLQLASRLLREAGYTVLTFGSAHDALAAIESHDKPIDLILTDVIMPKMNGPELIRKLARKRDDFKVLYMSGFTDVPLQKTADNGDGYNLIKKPFTRSDLLWKVRNVIDDVERPSRG